MEENQEDEKFEVIDTDNLKYTLGEKIGQGGQGAVYHVKNDLDIAVKLVADREGNLEQDDSAVRAEYEKLKAIRLLPIPENINLSKPLAILKSHAGYVMSFMNGMKSFDSFLKLHGKIEEEIPSWLKNADGEPVPEPEIWVNYCKTGSLRARLLALYKISELLASLHSAGLVYGDISSGNLMFLADGEKFSAGLIDADNINFAGKSKTYFTPGFGAPEIVTGRSHSTIFSDAYAFSVVAFYVITMMHPFKGSKVLGEENEDEGWSKSVSRQQKTAPNNFCDDGTFPWIFDQNDDSNSYGSMEQANSLFLTPTLFALFDNTFSEGHTKPLLRTPLARWSKAFSDSADLTVKCPACGMTHYYDYEEKGNFCCPYCSQKRGKILIAKSYLHGAENPSHLFVREIRKNETVLPSRVFEPLRILKGDEGLAGVKFENNLLELRPLDDEKAIVILQDNADEKILAGRMQFNIDNENFFVRLKYKNRYGYSVILTVE